MSIVQFDSQKIEQLLHSATSERQRKMYQALLNKARSQERSSTSSSASRTNPSTEKKVPNGSQTLTKEKNETKKKTQSVKKNQKANRQSATTETSTKKKQSKKTATESSKLTPDSSDQAASRQGLGNEVKDSGQNSPVQDYKPSPLEKKEELLPTSTKKSQSTQQTIDLAPQTELKSQVNTICC